MTSFHVTDEKVNSRLEFTLCICACTHVNTDTVFDDVNIYYSLDEDPHTDDGRYCDRPLGRK